MKIFEFLWDNGKLSFEMLGFFAVLIGFVEIKNQKNKAMRLWKNVREGVGVIAVGTLFILLIIFSKDYRDLFKQDDA